MISSYILYREQLVNVFLLIDIRHEPQKIDLEFMQWLGENGIPFSIVFTKADKLGAGKIKMNTNSYLNALLETWGVGVFIRHAAVGRPAGMADSAMGGSSTLPTRLLRAPTLP